MTEKEDQSQGGLLERVFGEPAEEFAQSNIRAIGLQLTQLMYQGVQQIRPHIQDAKQAGILPVSPWTVKHYGVEWDWGNDGGISEGVSLKDLEPNRALTEKLVGLFSANRNLDVFFLLSQGVALFKRRKDFFLFLPADTLPEVENLGKKARESFLAEIYEPFFTRESSRGGGVLAAHKSLLSPPPLRLEVELDGATFLVEVTLRFSPLVVDEVARLACAFGRRA